MPSWARWALWRVIKVIWLGGRKKFSFRWYGTDTWWVIRLSIGIGIGMYHQVLIFCHDRLTNTKRVLPDYQKKKKKEKRALPLFKINFGLLSFIVFIIEENFLAYQFTNHLVLVLVLGVVSFIVLLASFYLPIIYCWKFLTRFINIYIYIYMRWVRVTLSVTLKKLHIFYAIDFY